MNLEVDVSVIISTHNRAHYLDDALGALAAQNCDAAFEVIVIDNASIDDTNRVLEFWCRKNGRFRTAYEGRTGLSYGKNAGIRLARAPLLLFTDDDTVTDPHWIDAYVDMFARHRGERMIAGGTQIPIPHDLGLWPEWFAEPAMVNVAMLDYGEERKLTPFEYVWGANMAIPRSVFDKCGEWNETVGPKGDSRGTFEDTEFQDRARAEGIAIWFCPGAVIRHRIARETLTPRRITAAAFARGRNQLASQSSHGFREFNSVPKHNAFKVLSRLAANLMQWAFWAMTLRVFRRKAIFERARHAAFASGHTLETLRTGRNSLRMYFTVGRIVLRLRRVVLRLCPDFV